MHSFSVALNAVILAVGLPVAAMTTLEAEQVGSIAEADSAKLVKHHRQLFAFADTDDGLAIYVANKKGENWTKVDASAPVSADLIADTDSVSGFGVLKNKVYVAAVNSDGVAQAWNICVHCRPAQWEKADTAGFGDSGNTAIVDFFTSGGDLYAITENAAGNGLFTTEDGDSWTQVGEYGLGMSVSDVVAGSRVWVMDNAVHIGTASGAVYHADNTDLATWTLVTTFDGEITALRGRFVSVLKNDVSTVYESDQAGSYSQTGETITGSVTRFVNSGIDRLEVLVSNTTDGASYLGLNESDSSWDARIDSGLGNSNNITIDSPVRYHGRRYASTVNSTDGSELYRLTRN